MLRALRSDTALNRWDKVGGKKTALSGLHRTAMVFVGSGSIETRARIQPKLR